MESQLAPSPTRIAKAPISSSARYTGLVREALLEREKSVTETNEREHRTSGSRKNKEVPNSTQSQPSSSRRNIENSTVCMVDNGSTQQYKHAHQDWNPDHVKVKGGANTSGRPEHDTQTQGTIRIELGNIFQLLALQE